MTGSLLGPLDYMFGEVLQLAALTAALLALGVAFVAAVKAWSAERILRVWLFVTSISTILIFTQHNPYQGSGRVVDLNPFSDLGVAVNTTGRFRDIVVANVLLFVPLGFALAWRGTRFVRTAAFATLLSVACEVLQYASNHGRVAQTGDVVVNLAGAIVGWAAFVALTGGWGPLSRRDNPQLGAPEAEKRRLTRPVR